MIQNDYYHIAINDFEYLNATKHLPYYNQHCIACQQIAEKLLKHLITLCYQGDDQERLLKSHALRTLYRSIKKDLPSFNLNEKDLAILTDYYFDAKYPGQDFFTATKDDFEDAYATVIDIIRAVNEQLESNIPVI